MRSVAKVNLRAQVFSAGWLPSPRRSLILLLVFLCKVHFLNGQDWEREKVQFESVIKKAERLAKEPYLPAVSAKLPQWVDQLGYDEYRMIQFRNDQALWQDPDVNFRALFFHPGYLYKDPVLIHEFTKSHEQNIRLNEAFFDYRGGVRGEEALPADGGFSGFRYAAPLAEGGDFSEVLVFQGASYWRALGDGQHFGLSARGLAIDAGEPNIDEEFPKFIEFWLRKPEPGEKKALIYGLLDSPSVAGAYKFEIEPGEETIVTVRAVLFPRKRMERMGIAPMSSMFWFGENSRRRFDDFRPEVHDSDGLLMKDRDGKLSWRPLSNDQIEVGSSYFAMQNPSGFGLLQRDRDFENYLDVEAAYEDRPSLWIEPIGDWGAGYLVLKEIPTDSEKHDNLVVFWQGERAVEAGQRIEYSWRQKWTKANDPGLSGLGQVLATRTGVHEWAPKERLMIIDFDAQGFPENSMSGDPVPEVKIIGSGQEAVRIKWAGVKALPGKRWRLSFTLEGINGEDLESLPEVELEAALTNEGKYLSERWIYRIKP